MKIKLSENVKLRNPTLHTCSRFDKIYCKKASRCLQGAFGRCYRADGALYTVLSVHHTARLGLVKLNTCSLYGGKLRDLWNNPLKMMDNVIDNIYTSIYDKYLQVNAGGYPKKKIIKTEFVTSRIFVLFVINILFPPTLRQVKGAIWKFGFTNLLSPWQCIFNTRWRQENSMP